MIDTKLIRQYNLLTFLALQLTNQLYRRPYLDAKNYQGALSLAADVLI